MVKKQHWGTVVFCRFIPPDEAKKEAGTAPKPPGVEIVRQDSNGVEMTYHVIDDINRLADREWQVIVDMACLLFSSQKP